MKSIQKFHAAAPSSCSSRLWRRLALGGAALSALFASISVYGQGEYYPVNPPGAPYGNTYVGVTVHSDNNLQFLQQVVQSLYGPTVTLQVPVPTGSTAATTAQYEAAVFTATQGLLGGAPVPNVTLASLANEAVAWKISAGTTTTDTLAKAIIQFDVNTATANLNTVADALAKSQPATIYAMLPNILNNAAANATTAPGIPQIVATVVSDIPRDTGSVGQVINSGMVAINSSVLTAAQKTTAVTDPTTGFIATLLTSPAVSNNQSLIDLVVKGVTSPSFSNLASLTQVLNAAVAAVPVKSSANMGAIVDGALRSQGANATSIATAMAAANSATANYTNAVVSGYQNSANSTALTTTLNLPANAGFADAVAAGAIVKAGVPAATVVQLALVNGNSTLPRDIVTASISAAPASATTTITGAVNPTTHVPYGSATFGDLAYAGAYATPIEQIGNVESTILVRSVVSGTTIATSTLTSVIDNSIQGANAASKQGAFADIVWKSQRQALYTAGLSDPLVRHAIDQISAVGGDSYIAVVAAVSGDVYGTNRAAIQNAAYGAGGELQLTGGDVVAATNGASLVQALQTFTSQKYTATLSAFNTAANSSSAAHSAIADLYATILTNPTEYAAGLAAAIKQTSAVSDTVLITTALNAIHGTYTNLDQNLQMAHDVAVHIKQSALNDNTSDLVTYIGHQIVINPTLTKDIAAAATVVDPDNAHYIAHSVAFNNPTSVSTSVGLIFTYAQITNPTPFAAPSSTNPSGALGTKSFQGGGVKGAILDQPAAAAAITAGLTDGILEANLSATDTQNALSATISAAVAASLTQNGTNLHGQTNPFNAAGDTTKTFRQSDGASATSIKSGTQVTIGAAGAITGYISQVTNAGDSTINAITKAVLTAAVGAGARPYALEMAQAAAQALRWVGGVNVSNAASPTSQVVGNPAYDIALAVSAGVGGYATLAQLMNAAYFGITEAASGTIGAGALGLNATGLNPGTGSLVIKATGNSDTDFYQHRSATGAPVTNIFNL